jgi:hypothetical protein
MLKPPSDWRFLCVGLFCYPSILGRMMLMTGKYTTYER